MTKRSEELIYKLRRCDDKNAKDAEVDSYVTVLLEKHDTETLIDLFGDTEKDELIEYFCDHWGDSLLILGNRSLDLSIARYGNEAQLTRLADHRLESVRIAVAGNQRTPQAVLKQLCNDVSDKVASAAATNVTAAPDTQMAYVTQMQGRLLDKLEKPESVSWQDLGLLLSEADLPQALLMQLAERSPSFRFVCAAHPCAPESLWQNQLAQPQPWQQAAVALNPSVPVDVLSSLAAYDDKDINFALVCNPMLPETVQLQLANSQYRSIRHFMADRSVLPAVWQAMASHPPPATIKKPLETLLALAMNPDTPEAKLANLQYGTSIRPSNWECLAMCLTQAIIRHPSVPKKWLPQYRYYLPEIDRLNKTLAMKKLEGKTMVKAEPFQEWKFKTDKIHDMPAYTTVAMLRSGNQDDIRFACSHLSCDRSLLLPLLHSQDIHTLKRLATRTDMPRFFYYLLWHNGNAAVQTVLDNNKQFCKFKDELFEEVKAVSSSVIAGGGVPCSEKDKKKPLAARSNKESRCLRAHVSMNIDELLVLAKDRVEEVRKAVAMNNATPQQVLHELLQDRNESVRYAAIDSGRLRSESIMWLANNEIELLGYGYGRNKFTCSDEALMQHIEFVLLNNGYASSVAEKSKSVMNVAAILKRNCIFASYFQDNNPLLKELQLPAIVLIAMPDEETIREYLVGDKVLTAEDVVAFVNKNPDEPWRLSVARFLPTLAEKDAYKIEKLYENQELENINNELIKYLISSEVLMSIWKKHGRKIAENMALNPYLPELIFDKLLTDTRIEIRKNLARSCHPRNAVMVNDESEAVRRVLALSTKDIVVQKALSADHSEQVRISLINNENCDHGVLCAMLLEESSRVKSCFMDRKYVPPECLAVLLKDDDRYVRERAKCRLAYTTRDTEIQKSLAAENNVSINNSIVGNRHTDPEVLTHLILNSDSTYVLKEALNHPDVDCDIPESLLNHRDFEVRVAANKIMERRRMKAFS